MFGNFKALSLELIVDSFRQLLNTYLKKIILPY